MNVDTDKMVSILKNDKPISVIVVEQHQKDKLVVMFALPHLADRIKEFGELLIEEHEKETNP